MVGCDLVDGWDDVVGWVVVPSQSEEESKVSDRPIIHFFVNQSHKVFAEQKPTDQVRRTAARPALDISRILSTWLNLLLSNLSQSFCPPFCIHRGLEPLELLFYAA